MAAAIPFVMAGVSAASSMQSSSAENQNIEAQAQVLELQAEQVRKEGSESATQIRRQGDMYQSGITSAAAGSGVEVSTGSVLDAIGEAAYNVEYDALKTQENAEIQARSKEYEAEYSRATKTSGLSSLMGGFGAGASGYASGLSLSR